MLQNDRSLWIDITELFHQFALSNHPTGVSRVMINLVDALSAQHGSFFAKVQVLFWNPLTRMPLTFEGRGLGKLTEFFPALRERYSRSGCTFSPLPSGMKKGLITSIPKPFRYRLFPHLNGVTHFLGWARQVDLLMEPAQFAPEDCLFVPGSFWLDGYAAPLAKLARAEGASVACFIHDVLLLSNPEWVAPRHVEQFRRGLEQFLPCCTAVACNSAHTLEELQRYTKLPPNVSIGVCRLADRPQLALSAPLPEELADKRYVLLVSTMTPRKNHRLAILAWQRLWRAHGESTPWLVFVGSGVPDRELADLLAQQDTFGGRLIRFTNMDDATLEAVYANSWITLYPSLGEGYGLPVAEALARGKACLAMRSGATSEIAPDLVDLIDSGDPEALSNHIVSYLSNPRLLTSRERSIRTQYRTTGWDETASMVRCLLERAVVGCTQSGVETG